MYEGLVKTLHHCVATMNCATCPVESIDKEAKAQQRCVTLMLAQAADAIEEMSKRMDESIPKSDAEIIIEELSKPRWIPVEERLPEKNQVVVVVQRGKTWDYGQFRGLAYLGGNIHKWNWKNNTTKTVDYWMPKKSALPEPPKEE